jgi:hypothetical protein
MNHYKFCLKCAKLNVEPDGTFQPNEHFDNPHICKQCDEKRARGVPKKVSFADETCRWPSTRVEEITQDFKTLRVSD